MRRILFAIACLPAVIGAASKAAAGDESSPLFEKDIRPVLKAHCFHCHGENEEPEAGLDLRLQRLIVQGGDSGPAILPNKADESLLIERLELGEMPPEDVEQKLSGAEVALLRRWVESGAKTAHAEPETLQPGALHLTEEERNYWAFQPVKRPRPPRVQNTGRVRTPIDQFVIAKLSENGLQLSADADRTTLLRRAYFDLIGLPPTPQEAAEFLTDRRPEAYERLIDRLLASAHYGERWGRHWLDVAGYADSEGYTDSDPVRPYAYKYRDYVIRALDQDKPFDQFVVEQLAGDELIGWPREELAPNESEKLIATGFLRTAPDGTGAGGVDQGLARNEVMAKTIQIVSTSLLGLTVGCAQCHNHRYDPISQKDYYQFRAIFEPAYDWKNWLPPQKRRVSLYSDADRAKAAEVEKQAKQLDAERTKQQQKYIEQTFERELAKLPEKLRDEIRIARETPAAKRTPRQKKLLKENPSVNVTAGSLYLYDRKAADHLKEMAAKAKELRDTKPKEQFIRALWEPAKQNPPESFVFYRGDHEQPRNKVEPAELTVLADVIRGDLPMNDAMVGTTGRRLAYARWLTSGKHPLLARVIVNRVWMHHFGRGIVATPGDFGFLGTRPSHPQLLDWLADEFVRSGWSLKRLHRLIMTSSVYRQSSQISTQSEAVDAENRLLWRMPVRRLEAEVIRDSLLAFGDQLNRKQFGPPVPVMADRVGRFVIGKENLNAGRPGAVIPMHGEEFRRSVYIQVRRSRPLSVTEAFDLPRMEPNCVTRNSSTVAPQSLMLMNSEQVQAFAVRLAKRVRSQSSGELKGQIILAYQLVYSRSPEDHEIAAATAFLANQAELFRGHAKENQNSSKKATKPADPDLRAFESFCHALLSSNGFLYVD